MTFRKKKCLQDLLEKSHKRQTDAVNIYRNSKNPPGYSIYSAFTSDKTVDSANLFTD